MKVEEQWDGEVRTLPKVYIGTVLGMIDKKEMKGVRFGLTGKGIHPNYQLVYLDDSTQAMSGQNHKKFRSLKEFEDGNISRIYTKDELSAIFWG
ncbi:hypothetical protein [Nissabacter archeti]|uniref:hypothetical protein n=1 Tax=Nissabacter archeti TaxID=1917880 RepID=UPI0011151542|nr:hypothetical protein [Nissabacter archeti]